MLVRDKTVRLICFICRKRTDCVLIGACTLIRSNTVDASGSYRLGTKTEQITV